MARGGYRPGSGRKKGVTNAQTEEERQIREMLSLKTKAKAKLFNDLLAKIRGGNSITIGEKKMMDILAVELAAELDRDETPKVEGAPENLEPLAYMLRVMNDPTEDKDLRARMAVSAAPYIHVRKGEGIGKKEDKNDRAKVAAASGKFAPGKPPISLVK